jgi:transcriptional regulator with XRE-family HTH domain
MSLEDIEKASGVQEATLSRIERGLQKPRPSTLQRIAKALDVEVVDLWTEDEGKLAA